MRTPPSLLQDPLELGSVQDLCDRHPAYKDRPAAVRGLIQRADENGLRQHIYKVGRRVLIDLRGFDDWIRYTQEDAR